MAAALDKLDLVAIRVFDKGNDRAAMLHRAGFAGHFAAQCAHLLTGCGGIRKDPQDSERVK